MTMQLEMAEMKWLGFLCFAEIVGLSLDTMSLI
jgi:hypothetical protein